mmetsp:Transcript_16441/g.53605  ORF Transcript_16441/g.53605 Transcript_16441/m.53605 type:complete len:424 (-) Transcript_16441:839-2110(-)
MHAPGLPRVREAYLRVGLAVTAVISIHVAAEVFASGEARVAEAGRDDVRHERPSGRLLLPAPADDWLEDLAIRRQRQLWPVAAGEGRLARDAGRGLEAAIGEQHLIQQQSEGEDVRPLCVDSDAVARLALHLGRHVPRGAHVSRVLVRAVAVQVGHAAARLAALRTAAAARAAEARVTGVSSRSRIATGAALPPAPRASRPAIARDGQPKVCKLGVVVFVKKDVGWLDVAVHQVVTVHVCQPERHFPPDARGQPSAYGHAGEASRPQQTRQGALRHVLEHQADPLRYRHGTKAAADARMAEASQHGSLAEQRLGPACGRTGDADHLDRNDRAQPVAAEDGAHAALADERAQLQIASADGHRIREGRLPHLASRQRRGRIGGHRGQDRRGVGGLVACGGWEPLFDQQEHDTRNRGTEQRPELVC